MGEIYDKWSVCDWKVRCWEQETTQVLHFGGEWMVESSCGVENHTIHSHSHDTVANCVTVHGPLLLYYDGIRNTEVQ